MFNELIEDLVQGWAAYREQKNVDSQDRIFEIVTSDIPSVLRTWTPSSERYEFEGSTGKGNISAAPFFLARNPDISDSAQHGYYPVYLLSADLQRLVFQIGFGTTQFKEHFGNSKKMHGALAAAVNNMRANTAHLVESALAATKHRTNSVPVRLDNGTSQRLRGYEECSIYSLTYEIANLPSEESLRVDYLEYLRLYDLMAESLLLADVDSYVYELAGTNRRDTDATPAATESAFIPRQFAKRGKGAGSGSVVSARRSSKRAEQVGKLGEEIVVEFERRRLREAGRGDLAEKIVWHRNDPANRTPGWDVTSFETTGEERLIEVKASEAKEIKDVELTVNEWEKARLHQDKGHYCIYLVSEVLKSPDIQILRNPAKLASGGILTIDVSRYTLWLGAQNR